MICVPRPHPHVPPLHPPPPPPPPVPPPPLPPPLLRLPLRLGRPPRRRNNTSSKCGAAAAFILERLSLVVFFVVVDVVVVVVVSIVVCMLSHLVDLLYNLFYGAIVRCIPSSSRQYLLLLKKMSPGVCWAPKRAPRRASMCLSSSREEEGCRLSLAAAGYVREIALKILQKSGALFLTFCSVRRRWRRRCFSFYRCSVIYSLMHTMFIFSFVYYFAFISFFVDFDFLLRSCYDWERSAHQPIAVCTFKGCRCAAKGA